MNQTQRNAAKKAMVDWLKHPAELGKAPAKIECAGEFDLYDMHYYIFKYKKGIFGKWMLGVAGGYEGDELENCGHTFSEMQLYQEATAEKDAIALVEYVRNYIMEQANRAEEKKQNTGTFVNFVLLKDAVWNKEAFLKNLKENWGIEPEPQEDEEKEEESDETTTEPTPSPSPSPSPEPSDTPNSGSDEEVEKPTVEEIDYTLKTFEVLNGELDKKFDPNTFKYTVSIDSDQLKLKVDFTYDENAQYLINGNNNLDNGDVVKIIISDKETGKEKNVYKFTIKKDVVDLTLKSLKINGYALNEIFESDILSYTASIPYEIDTITVEATANDSRAKISAATGTTNLKVGNNTVKVTVKDGNGNSKTYKIVVTREKESTLEENPTSIITSSSELEEDDNSLITNSNNSNNNGGSDSFLKYAIVSAACLILFTIGGIGIYFYLKTSPKKLKRPVKTVPVKEEKEESPLITVVEEKPRNRAITIEELFSNTREFKKEELNNKNIEESFDEEDE